MQFTNTQKRASAWCLITAVIVLALWLLGPVLTPFLVAAVLAYALTPLVNRIDAWGRGRMPRVVAVILVELLFILMLLSLVLLIIPIMAKELPLMREQVPLLVDRLNTALAPWLAQFGFTLSLDVANIKAVALKYLNANYAEMFGSVLSSLKLGGSVALVVIGNAVLIPVALFYLLMDWNRLVARLLELVPTPMRAAFDSFTDEADGVLGQYLRGATAGDGHHGGVLQRWSVTVRPGLGLADWHFYRTGDVYPLPRLRYRFATGCAGRVVAILICQGTGHGGCGLWHRPGG